MSYSNRPIVTNPQGYPMSYSNRPTAPSPAAVQEWLAETQRPLVLRRDEILAGYKRFLAGYPNGIPDEDVQGRAADFAGGKGIMNTFIKECTSERDDQRKPFGDAYDAVGNFFKPLTEPVERCQKDMRARMKVFADKLEEERREAARLEAARLAAEAAVAQEQAIDAMGQDDGEEALQHAMDVAQAAEEAAALAVAKPSELSRTRGELGTVVSLRTRWVADFDESNLMELVKAVAAGKAPLEYLQFNTTRIGYAVRSEKVREIPGVVIKEDRSVV
jgi:hypothetical protein